jgi:peptidyl-prolyl cis-trans isomerase SurA
MNAALQPARTRATAAALLAVCLSLPLTPAPARAQYVVALVNGEPVTALDVAQRIRLHQISTRRSPTRQEVVEELINERIKLQQAARAGVEATDADVQRVLGQIAANSGRRPADFEAGLTQAGIDVQRFKTRIRAEIGWRQLLQRRTPFMVRDADIVALLTARGESPQITAVQYTLRQFVFVVPRGSPESVRAARVREAEAFRKSFTNCEDGVALARQYREVVVKDTVRRLSTDLTPKLRELLERTPNGTLTPPEPIAGGLEVVAVCDRRQTTADVSARREVREEILGRQLQAGEKELLEKFRRTSIIEYRAAAEQRP